MSYRVKLEPPAEKKLSKLDRTMCDRLHRRLRELGAAPFDPRISKRLKGVAKLRSSRVGDWRIIYAVDAAGQTVYILSVNPRGEVYRRI